MGFWDVAENIYTGGASGYYDRAREGIDQATEEQRWLQEMLSGEYDPYLSAGKTAIGEYLPAIQAMGDPSAFYNQMLSGYEESPAAQLARQEGLQAMQQGASASGMIGSGEFLKNMLKYGQQLTSADERQYFDNMMDIYGQYTGGLQNISSGGQQALGTYGGLSEGVSSNISDLLAQRGVLSGAKTAAPYAAFADNLSNAAELLGLGKKK